MLNGKPYISNQLIYAALEDLLYSATSASKIQPLLHLSLIDAQSNHPSRPPAEQWREFVLKQTLVTLVTEFYTQFRTVQQLPIPAPAAPLSEVRRAVEQDAQFTQHPYVGFSWLYYHYARADLMLSSGDFCTHMAIDERTRRRYQQQAIRLLQERLIALEWDVRRTQHQQRLRACLPSIMQSVLRGHELPVDLHLDRLLDTPAPLYITGEHGLDKAAAAERVVRFLIDSGRLQHVLWVERPVSAEQVLQLLMENLALDPPVQLAVLREYLLAYPTALVLYQAEALLRHSETLADLLQSLSPAHIILTSEVRIPCTYPLLHVGLSPLTMEQTGDYLLQLGVEAAEWDLPTLWQVTHGNPLLIRLHVQNPELFDTPLDRRFTDLDGAAQTVWALLALFPREHCTLARLNALFPKRVTQREIQVLTHYQVLETSGDTIVLFDTARAYIETAISQRSAIRKLTDQLLDDAEETLHRAPLLVLPLFEYLLLNEPIPLAADRPAQWVQTLAESGLACGHYADWGAILPRYISPQRPHVTLQYGVCLVRLGLWDKALPILQRAIEDAGMAGDFVLQSRASLEVAILVSHHGEEQRAAELLEQALRTAQRWRNVELEQRTRVEQAQMAIDQGRGDYASSLLNDLPDTPRVLLLRSEAALLFRQWDLCRAFASHAGRLLSKDARAGIRLSTLLGRCAFEQGQLEEARRCFAEAMLLAETAGDVFALARAQSNYAALLIDTHEYADDAYDLLHLAQHTQQRLGDLQALRITQHNLARLAIHRAKDV